MDEYTAEAFSNREEPIPVLRVPDDPTSADNSTTAASADTKGKRERLKGTFAGATSRLKDKVQESVGNKEYGYSLQDRLFTKSVNFYCQVYPHARAHLHHMTSLYYSPVRALSLLL